VFFWKQYCEHARLQWMPQQSRQFVMDIWTVPMEHRGDLSGAPIADMQARLAEFPIVF
jgi:hypothetical protein